MTKAKHTTDARILVGIDISKSRHEVLIAVPGKMRRRRMAVLNTAGDYQRLIAPLGGFELPVTIGFEATGNYHRALMYALGAAGFELKLVSSVALARIFLFRSVVRSGVHTYGLRVHAYDRRPKPRPLIICKQSFFWNLGAEK